MRRFSFLISRYILQAVLPYFVFTWLLLSVILFVQQAGRYSDLLFNTSLPGSLVWQLTFALIPNVLSFTCPIAILVGVIIGLSRMQGDSEMVSLRTAGVGNLQIAIPVVLLGILLSSFAFFINLRGVPIAAQIVRQVALQAALYKLESPIEPGVFNTEINGYTIYVKNGNIQDGTWEDIFIYQNDEKNKQVRLITSKNGRIDTKEDNSEIVLGSATVTTFDSENKEKIISEKVENLRLVVQTKRGELIEKLAKTKETPEEMGLSELALYIKTLKGQEKRETQVLLQRRILLSIAPLIFALMGTALVLKFSRGGRGFGIFLALLSLIIYYLLTLISEQLARVGNIRILTAALIPFITSLIVIIWLFLSKRLNITRRFSLFNYFQKNYKESPKKIKYKKSLIDFTTGILDFDLIFSLLKNFLLTLVFLISIYLVFTAFENWKFAGTFENGFRLLVTYLFFLIPYIYIQISPSALMIASLATYAIKSRQNEVVIWTAAGQSIYRLLLPCILLTFAIGIVNFGLQETVITNANRLQDTLLRQIRSRNSVLKQTGKNWIVSENRIYSFEIINASDNEKTIVDNLNIYEFNKENTQLRSFSRVNKAIWNDNKIIFLDRPEKTIWNENKVLTHITSETEIDENYNPFRLSINKPGHLTISETNRKIKQTKSEVELRNYRISIQKKYTTLFFPFVIILFTAPFVLSLKQKGNVITLGYAIGAWLLFMGTVSAFEQFGQSNFLSPVLAVWFPLILFTIIGFYLISRIRT